MSSVVNGVWTFTTFQAAVSAGVLTPTTLANGNTVIVFQRPSGAGSGVTSYVFSFPCADIWNWLENASNTAPVQELRINWPSNDGVNFDKTVTSLTFSCGALIDAVLDTAASGATTAYLAVTASTDASYATQDSLTTLASAVAATVNDPDTSALVIAATESPPVNLGVATSGTPATVTVTPAAGVPLAGFFNAVAAAPTPAPAASNYGVLLGALAVLAVIIALVVMNMNKKQN